MTDFTKAKEIYDKLPDKTQSGNVVIERVFQWTAINYATSIGGISSMRLSVGNSYGNPFTANKKLRNLIQVPTTKDAVISYINWVLTSKDSRAKWIRNQLDSGLHKNKPIVYYKELGEPSHANALDYLINNWESIKDA